MRHLRGYTVAPPFAWQSWRLRIPGGPEGGQYHGFLAPDSASGWPAGGSEKGYPSLSGFLDGDGDAGSAGPWTDIWGGTVLREGQTVSDHVYRAPGEMRPRPNASGGTNTVRSHQTVRSAGYALAPGNYKGLGIVGPMLTNGGGSSMIPYYPSMPIRYLGPPVPAPVPSTPQVRPIGPVMAPPQNGATATVPQPPPPAYPVTSPAVQVYSAPPISPAPAPTVAASPADFLPSQGQVVPGVTPGTTVSSAISGIEAWLNSSSIISGVSNWWIAGSVLAALALFGQSQGGRKR